jgi:hypothetical protein
VAQRHGGQLAQRVDAFVAAAPQHRPGQSGFGVLARADQVDADAVGCGTLEGGRLGLEALRRDAVAQVGGWPRSGGGPAQQVHCPLLSGQRQRQANQAMLAGRPAGA